MAEERKKPKLNEEEEDRISNLPDVIIQHILSFLPSTKESIQTGILSKRWLNQWTRVPILKFVLSGISDEKFSRFIDNTLLLYNCSKIQKFHIQLDSYSYDAAKDPHHFNSKLHFAIQKDVEELILDFSRSIRKFRLPEFISDIPSLVKLQTYNCQFFSMPSVSWGRLKELKIENCMFSDKEIGNILRGSSSLESFEVNHVYQGIQICIASKSLKKLVLKYCWFYGLQISCPNLEELKLVLCQFHNYEMVNSMDSPSLVSTTLNISYQNGKGYGSIEIIQKLRHVKELTFGSWFIQTLSDMELRVFQSSPLLNNKSLTLDSCHFEKHSTGIARALRCSIVLEKLVIKLSEVHKSGKPTDRPNSNISIENYWNSENTTDINCLVSHLKFVEINGLSESDDKYYLVLDFVEFLLKNAKVLEKLIVVFKDCEKDFVIKVSQELCNFPKCSQHVMMQLSCSN